MKFSDIEQANWSEIKPFVDTCLLPVTGLTGYEEPWQVSDCLARLRDALAVLETPFQGRIVTYPAYHYMRDERAAAIVNEICKNVKKAGFTYVIVLTTLEEVSQWTLPEVNYILHIDPIQFAAEKQEKNKQLAQMMTALWNRT